MEFEALCVGDADQLLQPCVDCGRVTGNFCETTLQQGHALWQGGSCFVADHVRGSDWAPNQRTPLCTECEERHGACRFCRKVHSCTPPAHRRKRQLIGDVEEVPAHLSSGTGSTCDSNPRNVQEKNAKVARVKLERHERPLTTNECWPGTLRTGMRWLTGKTSTLITILSLRMLQRLRKMVTDVLFRRARNAEP